MPRFEPGISRTEIKIYRLSRSARIFGLKYCMHFAPLPGVLHVRPIALAVILCSIIEIDRIQCVGLMRSLSA
jgi:hypothetical protein